MRSTWCVLALLLAGCGGGGGGGGGTPPPPPPVGTSVRLVVADVEIPTSATSGEVVFELAEQPEQPTALLQLGVQLPPELTVAPVGGRLRNAGSVVTLDGDFVTDDGGVQRFVVLCGDADNLNVQPLQNGALFGLTLQPTTPRQPGTYTVTIDGIRASAADGGRVDVDANPVTLQVTIR